MALYDGFEHYFPVTSEIIKCYDKLMLLTIFDEDNIDMYFLLIERISELRNEEFKSYNKFTTNDLMSYVEKLSGAPDESFESKDIRIGYRLTCIYDRMKNNTINAADLFPQLNTDIELSIVDIINSKIIIDTYKLITKKLNLLTCSDEKSDFYVEKLMELNTQNAIYRLSVRELSELLALDAFFDIDKISEIDLKKVDGELYKKFGQRLDLQKIVGISAYTEVINLLEKLKLTTIDSNTVNSIYDNLFDVSYFEVLLDYLTIEQLSKIASYYCNADIRDKMISNNVKTLIKNSVERRINN